MGIELMGPPLRGEKPSLTTQAWTQALLYRSLFLRTQAKHPTRTERAYLQEIRNTP